MIKKTCVDDLHYLENLERLCFPLENWNFKQIQSHHEIHPSLLYFAEDSEIPLGYLLYSETSFELEILRFGVLIEARRRGIAESLLGFLVDLAEARDIILEVNCQNFPAIAFYEKKGFINFAVRKRYYPDGKDAILMKKEPK